MTDENKETEKNNEALEERLIREGNLLRNSGTNSLKSLKDSIIGDNKKFGSVFSAINDSLLSQTRILSSIDSRLSQSNQFQEDTYEAAQQAERIREAADPSEKAGIGEGITAENLDFAVTRGTFFADMLTGVRENFLSTLKDTFPDLVKKLGSGIKGLAKSIPYLVMAPLVVSTVSGFMSGLLGIDIKKMVSEAETEQEDGGVGYSEIMSGFASSVGLLLLGKPIAALKTAMANTIIEMGEGLLGTEMPQGIQNAIALVFGLMPGRLTRSAIRATIVGGRYVGGLGLMGSTLLNPVSLAIIGITGVMAAMVYLIKKAGDQRKEMELSMLEAAAESDNIDDLKEARRSAMIALDPVSGLPLDSDQRERANEALRTVNEKLGDEADTVAAEILESPESASLAEKFQTISDMLVANIDRIRDVQYDFEPGEFEKVAVTRKEIFREIIEAGAQMGLSENDILQAITDNISSISITGSQIQAAGIEELKDYFDKLESSDVVPSVENINTRYSVPIFDFGAQIDTSEIESYLRNTDNADSEASPPYIERYKPEDSSYGLNTDKLNLPLIMEPQSSSVMDTIMPFLPDAMMPRMDNMERESNNINSTNIINSFNNVSPSDNRQSIVSGGGSGAVSRSGGTTFTFNSTYKKGSR